MAPWQTFFALYSLFVFLFIVFIFPINRHFVCFLFNRLFVRFHLSCAEDTLATIEEIVGGAMTELIQDEDKNACSATYPTLTRYRLTLELIRGSVAVCVCAQQPFANLTPFLLDRLDHLWRAITEQ